MVKLYDIMKAKKKTCKARGCKNKFKPRNSFHNVCCTACAIEYQKQRIAKKATETRRETKKKLEAIQPIGYWLKRAQAAFNAFIRERDKGKPCISCGEYITGKTDAGHYLSVGARRELRFHPSNCHAQCVRCNQHLSGNLICYRIGMNGRVGVEMVEYLENFNGIQKMTIDEVKEIEAHYKQLKKEISDV